MSSTPPINYELLNNNHFFSTLKVTSNPIPNMKLSIIGGGVWFGSEYVQIRNGQTPTFVAPPASTRWSLLVLENTGILKIIDGNVSTTPQYPNCPDNSFPLVLVLLKYGDISITSDRIYDVRGVYSNVIRSHIELSGRGNVDCHPITAITSLQNELDLRPTMELVEQLLESKADVDGINGDTWVMNKDNLAQGDAITFQVNTPSGEVWLRFNLNKNVWEYTNDGNQIIELQDMGPVVSFPIASDNILGAIKVGARLSVTSQGILSANLQSEANFTPAEKSKLALIENEANKYIHPSNPAHILDDINDTTNKVSMTPTERLKLSLIENQANNYIHPSNPAHQASSIAEVYDRYFMTRAERDKLSTVEADANYYEHPTNPVHRTGDIQEESNKWFMTDAERQKLTTVQTNANYYVHPATHSTVMIDDTSTPLKRFVRDDQITDWNAKATIADVDLRIESVVDDAVLDTLAKLSTAIGDNPNFADIVANELNQKLDIHPTKVLTDVNFTIAYESKLQGIQSGANFYAHPTNPSHTSNEILEDTNRYFLTDIEKQKLTNVPLDVVTQLANINDKEDLYIVGNTDHWAGFAPTNATEAIDRIAAAIYLLNGNLPIS